MNDGSHARFPGLPDTDPYQEMAMTSVTLLMVGQSRPLFSTPPVPPFLHSWSTTANSHRTAACFSWRCHRGLRLHPAHTPPVALLSALYQNLWYTTRLPRSSSRSRPVGPAAS